jgi:hypothetical protein
MFLGAHNRANHRIWIKLTHRKPLFSTLICNMLLTWTDSFENCCVYIRCVVVYEERAASLIRSETADL